MTRSCSSGTGAPARSGGAEDSGQDQGALYLRLRRRVDRIVRKTLGSDPECPDVAQDVFLEILRSSPKLKDLGCLESWASTVATYTVRRELRRRRRRRWVLCNVEDAEQLRYEPDTDATEVATRVTSALGKMPCEERGILIQRALLGCSMNQLASELGCSLSTARRRLNQARERLLCIVRRDPALRARLLASSLHVR
jgi:RNA polymerase sigma-70 factor (ECF subfamily)